MPRFRPRDLRHADLAELRRQLNEIQKEISSDIDLLARKGRTTELQLGDYAASFGDLVRMAPPSAGARLILPAPLPGRVGERVTLSVEAETGAVTVEVVDGTINGEETLVYGVGIFAADFVLTPDGWFTADGAAALTAPPDAGYILLAADPDLPNARVATSSASVLVDTSVVGQVQWRREAITGVVAIALNANVSTFGSTAASALRGRSLTVASNTLNYRRRPRYASVYDYFLSGTATSGGIGALGWSLLGSGTPTIARGDAGSFASTARLTLSTSGAANDRAVLCLGDTEGRTISPAADLSLLQVVLNPTATLTSKRIFFGLMGTFAVEPATAVNCLGIYYDSAVSANWQFIARSASAGTATVSSTAVASNTAAMLTIHQSSAGTYGFYVGNTLLGTISSGVPTASMNVGARLETLTAATRALNIGHFSLEATADGAYDDDAFLET